MALNEARYNRRLLQYVKKYLELPSHELTPRWERTLKTRTAEQWAVDISAITEAEAKSILGMATTPDISCLLTGLQEINGCNQPGVYIVILIDPSGSATVYLGSATSLHGGLDHRMQEHLNSGYRKNYMKRFPSLHYRLLDAGKYKTNFRTLARTRFASTTSYRDAFLTRCLCVFTEQVYMMWLRTHTFPSQAANQSHTAIAPSLWAPTWQGCNGSMPLKQDFPTPQPDVSPGERRDRRLTKQRAAYARMGEQQHAYEIKRRKIWYRLVGSHVRKMNREGASAEEIKKFKAEKTDELKRERTLRFGACRRGERWIEDAPRSTPYRSRITASADQAAPATDSTPCDQVLEGPRSLPPKQQHSLRGEGGKHRRLAAGTRVQARGIDSVPTVAIQPSLPVCVEFVCPLEEQTVSEWEAEWDLLEGRVRSSEGELQSRPLHDAAAAENEEFNVEVLPLSLISDDDSEEESGQHNWTELPSYCVVCDLVGQGGCNCVGREGGGPQSGSETQAGFNVYAQ